MIPPLVFEPLLKRIRWGGRKLGTLLGKPIGAETDYAESWEVADHADGQSVIADGPLQGTTLQSLIQNHHDELFGPSSARRDQFPLLIKYLDANDWLSLQVHPNDELARRFWPNERGKTEAWVIIDAEPGSQLCAGLRSGVTSDDLRAALGSGQLEPLLNIINVQAGDCLFVPAGTIHALGPGIVLAEVQQQSNLTFRLHDWGRMGTDGRPRPIHVEESLRCTDFARGPLPLIQPAAQPHGIHHVERLVECPYFRMTRHLARGTFEIATTGRFRVLMILAGAATLTHSATSAPRQLQTGSTVLVPACCGQLVIQPIGEAVTLLEVDEP